MKIWLYICAVLAFTSLAISADSNKAKREYELGLRLELAGQWQEAYNAFSASLDAEPGAPAYLHRAKTELALNLPQKAVDDLTEAIRIDLRIRTRCAGAAKLMPSWAIHAGLSRI